MRRLWLSAMVLATSLAATAATAQDAEPAKPAPGEVRKDPKGQTGISPYNEMLAEGRAALAKGDATAAVAAFNKAVQSDPNKMYGYLLLAQAQLRAGDDKGAYETVKQGRQKQGTEAVQAKMLLLFAELEERRADVLPPGHKDIGSTPQTTKDVWDLVKETFSAYTVFLTAHASVPGYKATADERKKQVDGRVDRDTKYAEVRKRMAAEAAAAGK